MPNNIVAPTVYTLEVDPGYTPPTLVNVPVIDDSGNETSQALALAPGEQRLLRTDPRHWPARIPSDPGMPLDPDGSNIWLELGQYQASAAAGDMSLTEQVAAGAGAALTIDAVGTGAIGFDCSASGLGAIDDGIIGQLITITGALDPLHNGTFPVTAGPTAEGGAGKIRYYNPGAVTGGAAPEPGAHGWSAVANPRMMVLNNVPAAVMAYLSGPGAGDLAINSDAETAGRVSLTRAANDVNSSARGLLFAIGGPSSLVMFRSECTPGQTGVLPDYGLGGSLATPKVHGSFLLHDVGEPGLVGTHGFANPDGTYVAIKLRAVPHADPRFPANTSLIDTYDNEKPWQYLKDAGNPRHSLSQLLLLDGRVFLGGGSETNLCQVQSRRTETFDEATGRLTPSGDMSTRRFDAGYARLPDGRVAMAGGFARDEPILQVTPTVEFWDPALGANGECNAAAKSEFDVLDPIPSASVAPLFTNKDQPAGMQTLYVDPNAPAGAPFEAHCETPPYPSSGSLFYAPPTPFNQFLQVAPPTTSPGASLAGDGLGTGTVTATGLVADSVVPGQSVTVSGAGAPLDGTFVVTDTPTPTSATMANPAGEAAGATPGTVDSILLQSQFWIDITTFGPTDPRFRFHVADVGVTKVSISYTFNDGAASGVRPPPMNSPRALGGGLWAFPNGDLMMISGYGNLFSFQTLVSYEILPFGGAAWKTHPHPPQADGGLDGWFAEPQNAAQLSNGDLVAISGGAFTSGGPQVGYYDWAKGLVSGLAASVVGAGGGEVTVTGLTGMTADHVDFWLNITGAANPLYNRVCKITAFVSATEVRVANAPADAEAADANNGAINWDVIAWKRMADMPDLPAPFAFPGSGARTRHFVQVLADDTVLWGGGIDVSTFDPLLFTFSSSLDTAFVFDPVANTHTPTGQMIQGCSGVWTGLTNAGQALVVHGFYGVAIQGNDVIERVTQCFTKSTNLWCREKDAPPSVGYVWGRWTKLPSGKFFNCGGVPNARESTQEEAPLKTAHLYCPPLNP